MTKNLADAVLQRNQAVLRYNSVLGTLNKYSAQLKSLDLERKTLVDADFSQIGADNPVMMAFLHRLYVDGLEGLQEWLYKAQRAYNFAALNYNNIISSTLQGHDSSQYNSTVLGQVQRDLHRAYNDSKERMGRAPQPFNPIKYFLDKEDLDILQDSEGDGKILRVEVSPRPPKVNTGSLGEWRIFT